MEFLGLTIILFRLSQSTGFSKSFSKVVSSASSSFEIEEIVLSAELYISEFSSVVSDGLVVVHLKLVAEKRSEYHRYYHFAFSFLNMRRERQHFFH